MKVKTKSGIVRPTLAVYGDWTVARGVAKDANAKNGRGHRAVKTRDASGYAVVFRPAVAANKQRKCRALGA